MIPAAIRESLPPTIVALATNELVLTRSEAVPYILKRLGGAWRYFALAGSVVPSSFRDLLYGIVAHVRHRVFRAPEALCPVVPPELIKRFAP